MNELFDCNKFEQLQRKSDICFDSNEFSAEVSKSSSFISVLLQVELSDLHFYRGYSRIAIEISVIASTRIITRNVADKLSTRELVYSFWLFAI